MMNVTVWSHFGCEVCEVAIAELTVQKIPFTRKLLAQTPELTERLANLGIPDLPAIEAGDTVWVGNRPELVARLAETIRRQKGTA
jgi:hypothetical protein